MSAHEAAEVSAPAAAAPNESAPDEVEANIERLANALEQRITEHGENDLNSATAYVEYAQALLRKAQAEGDPFGGALSKNKEGEAQGSAGPSAAPPAAGEEDEEGEEGEDGDEPESDDLELAFQCFEVARLIYEKAGSGHELRLAEVLEGLGEVAMENEMWEDAIGELERSLELKRGMLGPHDRQIAHLHYQIATAAVAQAEKARHDAAQPTPPDAPSEEAPPSAEACEATISRCQKQSAEHYQFAADVLERRLELIGRREDGAAVNGAAVKASTDCATSGGADEATELAELLAEVRAKVEEQTAAMEGAGTPSSREPASKAATTTIGFGSAAAAPQGVTTIGFGQPTQGVTTIGFGANASGFSTTASSLPVKNLGVVGGAKGTKRVRLDD